MDNLVFNYKVFIGETGFGVSLPSDLPALVGSFYVIHLRVCVCVCVCVGGFFKVSHHKMGGTLDNGNPE